MTTTDDARPQQDSDEPAPSVAPGNAVASARVPPKRAREIDGPQGPEPTRYGDWEVGGRCTDF